MSFPSVCHLHALGKKSMPAESRNKPPSATRQWHGIDLTVDAATSGSPPSEERRGSDGEEGDRKVSLESSLFLSIYLSLSLLLSLSLSLSLFLFLSLSLSQTHFISLLRSHTFICFLKAHLLDIALLWPFSYPKGLL